MGLETVAVGVDCSFEEVHAHEEQREQRHQHGDRRRRSGRSSAGWRTVDGLRVRGNTDQLIGQTRGDRPELVVLERVDDRVGRPSWPIETARPSLIVPPVNPAADACRCAP